MKLASVSVTRRSLVLGSILLGLILFWALFHQQIHRGLSVYFLLNAKSPREEAFQELTADYQNPVELLRRCWATGKVTHRAQVAAFLKANATAHPPWFKQAEPLLLAGTADADLSVRELSLAALESQHHPRQFACARAQLTDVDPMVRLLGLEYLRRADPQRAVPVVIRQIDDPDLRVVAAAEVALMRWSGEDYGVRARLAVGSQEGDRTAVVEAANEQAIRRGVERRKDWWQLHSKDFPSDGAGSSETEIKDLGRTPARDFELKDINGKKLRLTELRGKVVLLNFWATWCPACLTEIPNLIALEDKRGQEIAVIGIALDGVPDEEGEDAEQTGDEVTKKTQAPRGIHDKVARVVKARGINYTVLLDARGDVGGQFNGGELPTTVILDKDGRVRRRFIGERSPAVLEAMVDEAAR